MIPGSAFLSFSFRGFLSVFFFLSFFWGGVRGLGWLTGLVDGVEGVEGVEGLARPTKLQVVSSGIPARTRDSGDAPPLLAYST